MQSSKSCKIRFSGVLLASLVLGAVGCGETPVPTTGSTGTMGGSGGTAGTGGMGGFGGLGGSGGIGGTAGSGGMGGSGGSACVPEDDMNECTVDACDLEGMTTHTPKMTGELCSKGQCDDTGQCVECLAAADCPGVDDTCQTRTCDLGVCGMVYAAAGTPLPEQTVGDCKLRVCDGTGAVIDDNDDTDLPDDTNACTADTCAMGVPTNTNLAQGANCTPPGSADPLVCDNMGQCVGCNAPTDCPGADDECVQRTCNAGVCGKSFTAKDTPVMSQTANDCLVHVCDGNGKFVDIPDNADVPLDDGNVCTSETCAAGMPMHPNVANGSMCNDSNACTQADSCQMGVCTGASPVVCAASDQCHDVGVCNTMTGVCSNPAKMDGSFCNDGNSCTQADTCQTGACVGANPVVCSASDQCHDVGTCNPMTGICSNPNKANGTACSDGNACTQSDTCQTGVCTGANPVVCTASDQCHDVGTCNTMTGTCSNPNKANGTSCNDSNACTQTDSCQAGVCAGANPIVCMASDQCHAVGTCNTMTGMCSDPNAQDGTMCTLSGTPGVCSVGACTLCGNSTINMGEQCDDGNSVGGDGCNSACQYEEVEPNNTCLIANTLVLSGSPPSGSILGAITPVGDQDWYSFTIPAPSPRSVRIETNIGGIGQCTAATGSIDTKIFLHGSDCTTLLGDDDDDGVNDCSLIDPTTDTFARNLLPGTYKVRVIRFNNVAVINQYRLSVSVVGTCGNNIIETGEACDDGDLMSGDGCNATCGIEVGYFCSGSPSACFPNEINCNDGLDNNGSGTVDAADPSCAIPAYFPACGGGQHLLVYPMPDQIAIPNAPTVHNSNITVSGATQVARAAISFNVMHPFAGDVDIYLTAPGGMPLGMTTNNGGPGDNYINTVLDSTCAQDVNAGIAPFTNCYRPEQSLAGLNGTSANGVWQLRISDNDAAADNGTFNGWKLILCTSP